MNTQLIHKKYPHNRLARSLIATFLPLLLLGLVLQVVHAAATIFSEGFETYSPAATSLEDTSDADPAVPFGAISDDDPVDGVAGSGVQLINWLAHTGSQALLVRAGSDAQVHLANTRSGSSYQLDFWIYAVKGTGNRNFYVRLRGEGSDYNGDDYLAYQSVRSAGTGIRYYDGVGPDTAAWVTIPDAAHTEAGWQHHRIVIDPRARPFIGGASCDRRS